MLMLSGAVALIAGTAVATSQPTPFSPFPFVSILAVKLIGLPAPAISVIAGIAFSLLHHQYFIGRPSKAPSLLLTLFLSVMLLLSVAYFAIEYPLGIAERGVTHTILVLGYNVGFAAVACLFWFRARSPGNSRCQVYLGFTLFSWLSWCFLPYLGAVG